MNLQSIGYFTLCMLIVFVYSGQNCLDDNKQLTFIMITQYKYFNSLNQRPQYHIWLCIKKIKVLLIEMKCPIFCSLGFTVGNVIFNGKVSLTNSMGDTNSRELAEPTELVRSSHSRVDELPLTLDSRSWMPVDHECQ